MQSWRTVCLNILSSIGDNLKAVCSSQAIYEILKCWSGKAVKSTHSTFIVLEVIKGRKEA